MFEQARKMECAPFTKLSTPQQNAYFCSKLEKVNYVAQEPQVSESWEWKWHSIYTSRSHSVLSHMFSQVPFCIYSFKVLVSQ